MPPREGPVKSRARVTEPMRKLIRAMSPTRGIKRSEIPVVTQSILWKQTVNALVRRGYCEWGNPNMGTQVDRLFLTEKGLSYRKRYLNASAMGDLSLVGNGYRELKEDGRNFTIHGPWKS